ncbi:uncharacterized protein LOC135370933 [Ornithodoros turicata]|uniref:uncharacterized protein LOC135370933 n=1 Tax=Ornithodoros turicata TaxID=34597 RepID=UPI003139EAA1
MKPFVVCWTMLRFSYADITPFLLDSGVSEEIGCVDSQGGRVGDGDRYTPKGNDPCEQCTCQKGRPDSCSITSCYPPAQCSAPYLRRSGQCCDYACNGTATDNPNGNDTLSATNLGLRLVASTVTSFLILALLLFMIHRLRKRRLLVMIRRVDGCRRELDEACIAHHFAIHDAARTVGYFVGRDGICDDPPPPYTFWKPPETYVPPGEAPPPYEALSALCGDPISPFPVLAPPCDQVSCVPQTPPGGGEEASSSSSNEEVCDAVIRSDAYYEDGVATLPRGNVTIIHVRGAGQSGDPSVTSANVESNGDAVTENSASAAANLNRQPVGSIHEGRDTRTDRCSSYCEVTPQALVQNGAKRFSLPAPPNGFSSFPDPTDWNGGDGVSETSSSSASPDHSRGPFSPTSSESSCCSGDVDFARQRPPLDNAECMSTLPARAKGSLDRTLQCLRRFSFPGRKIGKKVQKCKGDANDSQGQACGALGDAKPAAVGEATNAVTVTSSGDTQLCRPPTSECASTKPASLSILANSRQLPGATPVVITVHCQHSRTSGQVQNRHETGGTRLSRSNSICSETGERRYREQPRTGTTRDACAMSVQHHPVAVDSTIPRQNVARQVAKLEAEGFRPQCVSDVNGRRHRKSPSNVSGRRTLYGGCNSDEASAL